MAKVEMGKVYRTRDGDAVELVSVEGREPYPVVGYFGGGGGPQEWTADGRFYYWGPEEGNETAESRMDLVEDAGTAEDVIGRACRSAGYQLKVLPSLIIEALSEAGYEIVDRRGDER